MKAGQKGIISLEDQLIDLRREVDALIRKQREVGETEELVGEMWEDIFRLKAKIKQIEKKIRLSE